MRSKFDPSRFLSWKLTIRIWYKMKEIRILSLNVSLDPDCLKQEQFSCSLDWSIGTGFRVPPHLDPVGILTLIGNWQIQIYLLVRSSLQGNNKIFIADVYIFLALQTGRRTIKEKVHS